MLETSDDYAKRAAAAIRRSHNEDAPQADRDAELAEAQVWAILALAATAA
ncbi:hypothetical protein OG594_08860 [Streptomyces sp. NBC_01214]|nr:hypothetical protein [Streptomyces sp. NBC_01214]MCX4801760.1 hypothetical protein [Streptomyces sp. NBC_01214]